MYKTASIFFLSIFLSLPTWSESTKNIFKVRFIGPKHKIVKKAVEELETLFTRGSLRGEIEKIGPIHLRFIERSAKDNSEEVFKDDLSSQMLHMPLYLEKISEKMVKVFTNNTISINIYPLNNLSSNSKSKYIKCVIIHYLARAYLNKVRGILKGVFKKDKKFNLFENLFAFYSTDFFVHSQKSNWEREFIFQFTSFILDEQSHQKIYPYTNYAFHHIFKSDPNKAVMNNLSEHDYSFTLSLSKSPFDHFGMKVELDNLLDSIQVATSVKKYINFYQKSSHVINMDGQIDIPENEKIIIKTEDVVGFGIIQLEGEGGEAVSFGHTGMLIYICGQEERKDILKCIGNTKNHIVVNPLGDTTPWSHTTLRTYVDGLVTGNIPINFEMQRYDDYIQTVTKFEMRDMVVTPPIMRDRNDVALIMANLYESMLNSKTQGYLFISNNCVSTVSRILSSPQYFKKHNNPDNKEFLKDYLIFPIWTPIDLFEHYQRMETKDSPLGIFKEKTAAVIEYFFKNLALKFYGNKFGKLFLEEEIDSIDDDINFYSNSTNINKQIWDDLKHVVIGLNSMAVHVHTLSKEKETYIKGLKKLKDVALVGFKTIKEQSNLKKEAIKRLTHIGLLHIGERDGKSSSEKEKELRRIKRIEEVVSAPFKCSKYLEDIKDVKDYALTDPQHRLELFFECINDKAKTFQDFQDIFISLASLELHNLLHHKSLFSEGAEFNILMDRYIWGKSLKEKIRYFFTFNQKIKHLPKTDLEQLTPYDFSNIFMFGRYMVRDFQHWKDKVEMIGLDDFSIQPQMQSETLIKFGQLSDHIQLSLLDTDNQEGTFSTILREYFNSWLYDLEFSAFYLNFINKLYSGIRAQYRHQIFKEMDPEKQHELEEHTKTFLDDLNQDISKTLEEDDKSSKMLTNKLLKIKEQLIEHDHLNVLDLIDHIEGLIREMAELAMDLRSDKQESDLIDSSLKIWKDILNYEKGRIELENPTYQNVLVNEIDFNFIRDLFKTEFMKFKLIHFSNTKEWRPSGIAYDHLEVAN